MPKIDPLPQDGRIAKGEKLKRQVERLLSRGADAVIALTDVYTGTTPPDFVDAADAKHKMLGWVGSNPRFHPHAAQFDFEAWLLPYWSEIQKLAGHNRSAPSSKPEQVNHNNPPAHRLHDLFNSGKYQKRYSKTRDATRILRGQNLTVSADACPELKSFLNTILTLCGGTPLS
jgi:hypothetical protein